ncbi:MAG: hypothetical protein KIG68_04155 [Oxalobacter sp.]|nr:hypothetical protein [Oxalobacter sp.]
MKAYLYKETKNKKSFICSKFDNSNERVTIYHEESGIYHQYWRQGQVIYTEKEGEIINSVPSNAVLSENEVGTIINHVWRPGLCLNINEALDIDNGEKSRAKRELKILIEKLHEILMYIEPDPICLQSYGHKIRELLILACTECENTWTAYIRLSGNKKQRLTTNEYIALKDKLFLAEYRIKFLNHPITIDLEPFKLWNVKKPTESLSWYNAYNQTKHNREDFFNKATLENCLNAIAANIVLFCVRYSPYDLNEESDLCSKLINEYFSIELSNPNIASFYIPHIKSVSIVNLPILGTT